jgi:glycosyltransferase involved in cell wall biosynthesis
VSKPCRINGRFATQRETGVQRYGHLFLDELSDLAEVIVPKKNGPLRGQLWEQHRLPRMLREQNSPLLINFCNTGPVSYKNQIVTIHDLAVFENPAWFNSTFAGYYRWMLPRLAAVSHHIVTVSAFSKQEIVKHLNVDDQKVSVIHSAVSNRLLTTTAKQPPGVSNNGFCLMVGSHDPRKNFDFIATHAHSILKERNLELVIAGSGSSAFQKNPRLSKNAIWLQDVNDNSLRWLYENSALVIHPAIYEGFSLVPCEALALGAQVLISDIQVHREIVGDAASYFNISSAQDFKTQLIDALDKNPINQTPAYVSSPSSASWTDLVQQFS